jgi:hypothetical protein
MVAERGAVPLLTGVKDGKPPVPEAANPMEGSLLVQVKVAPGTLVELKFNAAAAAPLQKYLSVTGLMIGVVQ